jgi:hypothetical protein
MRLKQTLGSLVLALGTTALVTSSYAQTAPDTRMERNSKQVAIHDCSRRAAKFPNDTQETNRIVNYHACMGDHGWQG